MPRTDCLTPDELRAFHLGDLPEAALDEVAAHLECCQTCEVEARRLDTLIEPQLDAFRRSARAGEAAAEEPLPPRVGDYEVLECVGRGGMGVVYRAWHVTLRRTVALKMLLGGTFADREDRLRFRAEAEAVARLQHPHIVQLFDIGEWRPRETSPPLPYFTLEFVDGGSLAARLAGRPQPPRQAAVQLEQLARAVHYAHEHNIVHRDLKPSNVLLTADGQPKVCDFGVAKHLEGSDVHTRSGTLVGTAEYMAPEQAEGKGTISPEADTYALGAILYTMLAGHPPFQGATPLETLDQVRTREPVTVRRLQPTVPRDLETICLKCLQKDPRRRYTSAEALADDLGHFLAGEPIRARPVGPLERAAKWVRRRPALAALLAVLLLGGAVGAWQAVRLAQAEREQADRERDELLQQAKRSQDVHEALGRAEALRAQARAAAEGDLGKWTEARAMARRAEAFVESGPVEPGLADRVAALLRELRQEEKDRQMVAEVNEVRLRQAEVSREQFDTHSAGRRYAEAFKRYGLDVEALPAAEAARRLRGSAIREDLLAALDDWAWYRQDQDPGPGKLWAVADGADDNDWRRRLRKAAAARDADRLKDLAGDEKALAQPPPVLALAGEALQVAGLPGEAADWLKQAQQRHPDDFWINHHLAYTLFVKMRPRQTRQAVGYFRAALAVRPGSAGAHFNLGNALREQGDLPGAAACYRRACEINPKYAAAHCNLGVVLSDQGDLPGAVACYREGLKADPEHPNLHNNLGNALHKQGDLPGAVASYRRAVEAEPGFALAHRNLAAALREQGDLPGAAAGYRRAVEIEPEHGRTHFDLGFVLIDHGDVAGAAASYRRATALEPNNHHAHYNLGRALARLGDRGGAVASYRRALEIEPEHAEAHCNLGNVLIQQGKLRAALAALRTGHELGTARPGWRYDSEQWVKRCERFIDLDRRLPAVLKGEAQPADASEGIELADLCRFKGLYASSARLFAEALAADAGLAAVRAGHLYRAACSAALAGCGQGEEGKRLDKAGQARLRRQALGWLRADLAGRAEQLKGGGPGDRKDVQEVLEYWQGDPALAGVQDAAALDRLAADERAAWQGFWADVEALREKARDRK